MPSPQKSSSVGPTEVMGSGNFSNLSEDALKNFQSKVTAPRNPKLLRSKDNTKIKMTPSMYMKQMQMDTEQKLASTHEMHLPRVVELLDMSETTHQKVSYVDIDQAMFQPFPSEMFFQNFEPFKTYELPLLLRNNDKIPRLIKVIQTDSPYFRIISPDDVSHKVAPGMASVFKIQFTPEDKKDYTHELICMTEREKFIVPIQAIGARAILDFPDHVNFSTCAVKHNTTKTLLVRNIGNAEAKFSLEVSKPFSVSNATGSLAIGDSMQVSIEFTPNKVGDHQEDLVLRYDTGEEIVITLYGASVDANVRLDKNTIRIDNTFIQLANQRTITIHNRSNIIAHYRWSQFATQIEEQSQRDRFTSDISEEERLETDRFIRECTNDPTLRDRMAILTRTFVNRRELVGDDPLLFQDEIFTILPVEGDIWPNSTAEITIVFKPQEAISYNRTIFCDISGRESRLPLKIRGDGMGPKLAFSYDSLDIGSVFAGSTHTYEIVLINKGDIDAIFSLAPEGDRPAKAGAVAKNAPNSRFHFEPVEGIVLPDGHQAMDVTFKSEKLGDFSQDFYFNVDGSPSQLKFNIIGCVIGPTFNFDVPRLRFGNVSYGFVHSKLCTLSNTSLVPMSFNLRAKGDGTGELSISSTSDMEHDSVISEPVGTGGPGGLREFDVTPAQGTVAPQSEIRIQVSICSNTLKRYDYALVVDVVGVGKDILSLPITAQTVVPGVQIITPILNYGRCFLNHPYQLKVKILNDNDLPAKYDLVNQVRDELTPIMYGSPLPKGILEPHTLVEVPILMQAIELGHHEVNAFFAIFGNNDAPLPVQIQCIGEGPVVNITPQKLDWGKTEVLKPVTKTVVVSNESLIPAEFFAKMMRPDSIWKIEPEHGEVQPHEEIELNVTATLDDCIKFLDKMTVQIVKGSVVTIPVNAVGYGTTIVTDPPLTPAFDLGPHFARSMRIQKVKVTNKGRRHQALVWGTEGFVKQRHRREPFIGNEKDMKVRDKVIPPQPASPIFSLYPSRFALEPGQSIWTTLQGTCDDPKLVKETLTCNAIIGKANGKERIMRSKLTANFVAPLMDISQSNLYFRVDKRPEDPPLMPQTASFRAKNVSSLPITCVMSVTYPFQLLALDQTPQSSLELNLLLEQEVTIGVWFDPCFKDDLHSRVAESHVTITYKEHPQIEYVQLKGEVNFPNLEFSSNEVDFDCILNDTEVAQFVDVTNTSPMPVSYRWSFVVRQGEQNIKYNGTLPVMDATTTEYELRDYETKEYGYENPDEDRNSSSSDKDDNESPTILESDNNEIDEEVTTAMTENSDVGVSEDEAEFEARMEEQRKQEEEQQAIEEERKRAESRLSSRHQPSMNTHPNNLPLLPWLNPGYVQIPNGVEEIYDILPLYGTLDPGETQRVTFTFYGHADVSSFANAVCEVHGGPKYDIMLKGEASLVEYRFDNAEIDFGKLMFDEVACGELQLANPGRVAFNFTLLDLNQNASDEPEPGVPLLVPSSGKVEAFSEITIKVYYLPGIPEKFHKSFEIQVAHFEPSIINVVGEGTYPCITMDLPRNDDYNEHYTTLLKEARENLERETKKQTDSTGSGRESANSTAPGHFPANVNILSDHDIHVEAERLLLKEFALNNRHVFSSTMQPSAGVEKKKKKFPRICLSEYLLDFGYVVLGNIRSHIVRITNTSHFSLSFSANRSALWHSGFSVELDKVKNLPGHPDNETIDFKVTFDPRGVNIGTGPVDYVVPINIVGGAQIRLRLKAEVTVPELQISSDSVEFGSVQCGQCKIISIQLYNHKNVKCEWTSLNPKDFRLKMDKHIPMHLRKKLRKELKPKANHFEIMPANGILLPGQRKLVQVKFMPTEEKVYTQRLSICIAQSTMRLSMLVSGEGMEPRLDFIRNLVEFKPILPHSAGEESEVVVRNPCPFPIEFYSLEFDKQYLMEEKILRLMKGYDEHNNILLPPRLPGEDLPPELTEFYDSIQQEELSETRIETELSGHTNPDDDDQASIGPGQTTSQIGGNSKEDFAGEGSVASNADQEQGPATNPSSRASSARKTTSPNHGKQTGENILDGGESTIDVGELENTPVNAANARYLGLDLSTEGKAAVKRRGIVVIVHGAPMSGKTSTSVMLAKRYGAARLTIDDCVRDAISNGNTPSGHRAKEYIEHKNRDILAQHSSRVVNKRDSTYTKTSVKVSRQEFKSGLKARELCAQAAQKQRDDEHAEISAVHGGLSVEAVTAHTGTEAKPGAPSVISTKKTSVVGKQGQSTLGSKQGGTTSDQTGSQVASTYPAFAAPIARRLSVSASVAGEDGLLSCILPENLLIDLLAERMQLNDCHHGVIIDGLDTLFSPNPSATLLSLLKAINNRKHIYYVNLKLDLATVKAKEKEKEDERLRLAQLEEEEEKRLLEEMNEDEYDALSEERRMQLEMKRLQAKREKRRLKEEMERIEREKKEHEKQMQAEMEKLEVETTKGKKGKGKKREETGKRSISGKHGAELPPNAAPGKAEGKDKALKTVVSLAMVGQMSSHDGVDKGRPDSRGTDRPESLTDDGKKGKKHKHRLPSEEESRDKFPGDKVEEKMDEDKILQQRFKSYEVTQRVLVEILEHWDRSQLVIIKPPPTPEVAESQIVGGDEVDNASVVTKDKAPPSGKKAGKKEREKERQERERLERERLEKERIEKERLEKEKLESEQREGPSPVLPPAEDSDGQPIEKDPTGIPCVVIDMNQQELEAAQISLVENSILPSYDDVLDGLGLGPKGPPIPPPASFSVVPYPVRRKAPASNTMDHYMFVSSGVDDPNAPQEEKPESVADDTAAVEVQSRADSKKEDYQPPSSRKSRKDKSEGPRVATGRRSSARKSRRGSAEGGRTSPNVPTTPGSEADQSSILGEHEFRSVKLTHFRWIVPAHGETLLRLKFTSKALGLFDQTLSFELVGTRRRYQLFCRGVCSFPTISREPRVVFPHRRKTRPKPDEPAVKKYILQDEVFEFGPLLCGKTRERYKEGRYPENMERLTINNTSPLDADVSFCFQHDHNASTFLLDPPNMFLRPNESKTLTIWAYPKLSGSFTDALVCCVRENPEPICFTVSCHGVRPELELDRKHLHFDKVLLHRKETKTLFLRNSTMLPVAWRVSGMENMGDDFSLNQDTGVIDPRCEFGLQLHFRATRSMNIKKNIRLEISDVDNIMGLVQTENVQVTSEAYDVALDMSFPKGADGGLDFGTIRVMDESKQTCSLKNKGRYEISFSFLLDTYSAGCPPVEEMFSILPQKGTLVPNDRPTQVQVIFKSKSEVTISDLPLLKCQVIEPNIGDSGEVIALIPIKLSVRSVFSKFTIFPSSDVNFGPMILGQRKSRTFSIENKGEFDFKYTISKLVREQQVARARPMVHGGKRTKSRDGSSSSKSVAARGGRAASIRQDAGTNQTRLQVGTFAVFPGFGTILPGATQSVTVDCLIENFGKSEEFLAIDITDRETMNQPGALQYKLLAEGCQPSINIKDIGVIFEEHRICKSLQMYMQSTELLDGSGVYAEEDNKFLFKNVIVGRKAYARFKITNTNKVPVDVTFTVKPISNKVAARIHDIFDVEPSKSQIQPHHFVYATVSFTPPSMSMYHCYFEAAVDGLPANILKGRNLFFEVLGEGNLPRVSVKKPVIRNKLGEPLLIFQRLLNGRTECLPLTLYNDGSLPSKVNIIMEQRIPEPPKEPGDDDESVDVEFSRFLPDFAYSLRPINGTRSLCSTPPIGSEMQSPYTASVVLQPQESAFFEVIFSPDTSRIYHGQIRVLIVDNVFEEHKIQLHGEGFQDDVTFDNLYEPGAMSMFAGDDGIIDTDVLPVQMQRVPVTKEQTTDTIENHCERINFGDCSVGVEKKRYFSITNHSDTSAVKFAWENTEKIQFTPKIGHLQPGCSKDVEITFVSSAPFTLDRAQMKCNISKIEYENTDLVSDWDDRNKTTRWITLPRGSDNQPKRPAKKKVEEIEPEPVHTIIEGTTRTLVLLVSAKVNYAKCKCTTDNIKFKETLLYQARICDFTLQNTGDVVLQYDWKCINESPITVRPPTASTAPNTARSTNSLLPTALIDDNNGLPFSLSPESGEIKPGKKQSFTVRFAPSEVSDFQARLICSIPNMTEDEQGPVIQLRGHSIMPECHFELADSDYLSGSRRNSELRGPGGAPPGTTLDPNTRVIEFNSIGIGMKNIKKFWILNPTTNDYSFVWRCEDQEDARVTPQFTCKVREGDLRKGKKLEMCFEYTPQQLHISESFWRFVILEQNISIPFLLVGNATEPRVGFSNSYVNFKGLLVGRTLRETIELVNSEPVDFTFTVDAQSCHSAGYASSVEISPMKGVVQANQRLPILVSYTSKQAGEANFNIICAVARKTMPLTLNVKATSYSMQAQLLCENSQGIKIELSPHGLNAINFGEVELHEKAMRQFFIVNSGKHNFTYSWTKSAAESVKSAKAIAPSAGKQMAPVAVDNQIQVTPNTGSVASGSRKKCTLVYQPKKLGHIKIKELELKVQDGPTYLCHINGECVRPGLSFSFDRHNFGPCFIYRAGMPTNTVTLHVTNKDSKDISLECLYVNTQHMEVDFQAKVLIPGANASALITFYPRILSKYKETIPFQINGLSMHNVTILGEGTEMRVEVLNPKQKMVKLGALRLGEAIKQIVPIVNKSPTPISLNVSVTPVSQPLQDPSVLQVMPIETVTLEAKGGTKNLEVYFSPKTRIPQFTEEIMMECAGLSQPLFVIQGCCQGIEISLDQDSVPFGAVVQRSQSIRRILMQNTGDIGARFHWNAKKFLPDFSIEPVNGYISPGMEVSFTLTFHPREICNDIRYEGMECHIEGAQPLLLTLTGICIGAPSTKEVVLFNCPVRSKEVRSVTISNKSNQRWNLNPIIDGEYWTGADVLTVDGQQSKGYELTYRPLTMTMDGKKHQGSVFFPQPDGNGILYNLQGQADPPNKPVATITRDVPCKTAYTEALPVSNWLRKPQRFKVVTEMIKPDKLDIGTTLKGLDYIDVPGSQKRDFKLHFMAHKEGVFAAKIIFRNESTSEFIYYYVTFRATSPGVIESIDLQTPVRRSTAHTVKVENPLPYPITFQTECKISDINLPPQFTVPPNSEGSCMFEYQPLKAGEGNGKLVLTNVELGTYTYDLQLTALTAAPEKTSYFNVSLGGSETVTIRFQNYARQKTDYICKIEKSSFICERSITAAPASSGSGTEVTLDVTFEPTKIGEMCTKLTVTSSVGGEYVFPLVGKCTTPRPQGPYVVRAKSNVSVPFKNVFSSTTVFTFNIDNPLFSVKPGEAIRSKKTHNISIQFDGTEKPGTVVTAKMSISCVHSAGSHEGSTMAWVFYLKGITPDNQTLI